MLLEHCMNVIKDQGQATGRWIEIETAAFLLGRDFSSDDAVLAELVNTHEQTSWNSSNALWALCEGWPSHDIVERSYSALARRAPVGVVGTPLGMLLVCRKAPAVDLIEVLAEFVSRSHSDMSYHAAALTRPIVRRIAGDLDLQSLLLARLKATEDPSQRVTFSGLLVRALGLTSDLRKWAMSNVTKPEQPHFYSPVGFDLTAGTVRTVWDKSLEILQSI